MAFQAIWHYTNIPDKIVDVLEEDLVNNFDPQLEDSRIGSGNYGSIEKKKRNARNAWVSTSHWIGGFIWHYVNRANRENFMYDLDNIDGETIQYTVYGEGQYYGWHSDAGVASLYKPFGIGSSSEQGEAEATDFINTNCQKVRKLSFSLLLSDPDTYEGGNLQIMDEDGTSFIAPRQRGSIILFDSRCQHRVQKVTKGVRKSLVGWTVGPRWK